MRSAVKIMVVLFIAAAAVSAQTAKPKPKAKAKATIRTEVSDVTTAPRMKFPREKFDPLRDPKADLEKAMADASSSGRRIILDVGGEWCGWCIYMDKYFLENPPLTKLRDDNFVWIKVNMSPENENVPFLSAFPEASGYPHLYVLDAKGALLHSQNTSELESGKGYNLEAFTAFLKKWSPTKEK